MNVKPLSVKVKVWIEYKGKYVMGLGLYNLLSEIEKNQTISKAAKLLQMSYKFAWNLIKRAEKGYGVKLVKSIKGGAKKGITEVTAEGKRLLTLFEKIMTEINEIIKKYNTREIRAILE